MSYVTSERGTEYVWAYRYDEDYANSEGEAAVIVMIGRTSDDEDVVLSATLGGITLESLSISDHGNIHVSPEDEAYLRTIAQELANEEAGR